MAGKGGGEGAPCAGAAAERSEEEGSMWWRKRVDMKLKRVQSLVLGAEVALDNSDFSTAQVLALRLIGFLDSQSLSTLDHAYITPIRHHASSILLSANRSLIPQSHRLAFQQAGKLPARIFGRNAEMDFDNIKQSKYFQLLLPQQSRPPDCLPLEDRRQQTQDKATCKTSKNPVQANLTSLYGNNIRGLNNLSNKCYANSRGGGFDDRTIIEMAHPSHNIQKGQGLPAFPRFEEEEKAHRNSFGTKRSHSEIRSPESVFVKPPASNDEVNADASSNFVTARAKLEMDARQRRGLGGSPSASSVSPQSEYNGTNKLYVGRSYGFSRRGIRGNFVPPIKSNGGNVGNVTLRISGKGDDAPDDSTKRCLEMLCGPDGELPEKLRNLEPRLIEHVSNEIMDRDPNVCWEDIAGLDHAKKCVTEMVIWPLLRPDIFKGCRSPGRGLLLFGPPGTGKTMIGKAIAGEAKATFFYISASSLTSKWIGEGEKLVRALFGVASCRQPAVIFVDEIDSLLSQRKSEGEHESSRRLKTQFLIEMEGFDTGSEQILLIGATNRPQELDEAARRRLTKRLYIPLPSSEARAWIIQNLLEKDGLFELSNHDTDTICKLTEGYSGSDMKDLVKDASMGPLREALRQGIEITKLKKEDMRPITLQDFENALLEVRPSVSLNELGTYEEWNKQFGSLSL